MVRFLLSVLLLVQVGCSHMPKVALEEGALGQRGLAHPGEPVWHIGPPSPKALSEIARESKAYYRCIVEELGRYRFDGEGHALDDMEGIMRRCDPRLLPIRKLLERERIHPQLVERVLRRRRIEAAGFLTRQLQAIEARSRLETASERIDPSRPAGTPTGPE